MGWANRVRNLWWRRKLDADIDEELRAHLEMAAEDGIRAGMSEDEARRRARLRFGNPVVVKERTVGADAALGIENLWRDVKFALRQLRRAPTFSLTAILTLALGIGASTAIFSLVRACLLRPLPYPHPDRLVMVWEQLRALGIDRFPAPIGDFVDYRNDNRVFEEMAAVENAHFVLRAGDYPERIFALRTTANLFPMMGLQAQLGRTLTSDDNRPGHGHVVVLSDALWRERFGGDRGIVGKNVVLDGANYEVVGVLARDVRFSVGYPRAPALWVPLAMVADPRRETGQLEMVARLRVGVTLTQAQTEMDGLAARLEREYHIEMGPHGENPGYGLWLVPLHEQLTGNLRQPLLLMLGATLLVFLIACANIANLMMAHGVSREREFAIRISLGAGRGRLTRLLLTEAAVVALLGAVAGVGIAATMSSLLIKLSPYETAKLFGVSTDGDVLAFAAGMAALAVLLFGMVPALGMFCRKHSIAVAATGHQVVNRRGSQSACQILVAAEMALSVALVIAAGMLIQSFARLREVPLGFHPSGLLTAEVNLPPSYSSGALRAEFYEGLLERIRAMAGVDAAAASTMLPAADVPLHDPFSVEGRPWRPFGADRIPQFANHQAVSTGYFRAMGIALREGRVFTAEDREGSPAVAIVNEEMARGFWPGESPIGKHLMLGDSAVAAPPWLTIVGVAADVRSGGATAAALPELYTPMAQTPASAMALVVRSSGNDPEKATGDLRAAVKAMDRGIPLENVATYDELLAEQLGPRRYEMLVLAAFGALSLLLAAVGLYGVAAYAVTRRTREIGVRMAFGATGRDVIEMVLRQALLLAGCGMAAGIGMALLFRQVLRSEIFGRQFVDLPVYAAVALLLSGVTLAAAYVPARRAAGVDPMTALRSE